MGLSFAPCFQQNSVYLVGGDAESVSCSLKRWDKYGSESVLLIATKRRSKQSKGATIASEINYDELAKQAVEQGEAFELPDELLDAVAGGVLDDSYKKFIKAIVIIYKGTGNSLDQTISIRRSEQVPQEELDYIREIWDSTQV